MESFFVWILESSLLVCLILCIRKIFMGKIRYTAMYALWLVILVRFLIPVNFISTPFSIGTIVSEKVSTWTEKKSVTLAGGAAALPGQDRYAKEAAAVPMDAGAMQGTTAKVKTKQQSKPETKAEPPVGVGGVSGTKWTISDGVKKLIFGSWLFVSAILLLWLIMSNVNLNRKMKKNRTLYGKREGVCIYLVSGINNPCLYGFFRPAIYLPAHICNEDRPVENKEEIGQMILHEYVHYCHGDHLWAMFRILLVSFYWFDPFMWLAVSCSKKDAELACDETVIYRLGERKRFLYGEMLVRLAADTNWRDFRYSMMAMSRKGKEMEKRIRAISVCRPYSKWILIPMVAAVFLTAGITCSTGIGPLAREQRTLDFGSGQGVESTLSAASKESLSGGMSTSDAKRINTGFGSSQMFGSKNTGTDTYEDVFYRYIECFTKAVNTGNVDAMNQVLAEGSAVYKQQCDMAKNYYKRGIREEVKACYIVNVKKVGVNAVSLESKEKIKVTYADTTSKIIDQTYLYRCEQTGLGWRIKQMDEIEASPYK